MKKLLLAAATVLALSSTAQAQVTEQPAQIQVPCFPTQFFIDQMGEFRVLTSFEHENPHGHKLVDALIYSKTQDAMFVVRENEKIKHVCILTMFEEVSKSKAPEKKQEPKKDTKPKNHKQV